ncbi:BRO family protein [Bacillus wiedmannii]|uniref:BRO family protein n=1 Tax=Bacillus wiedmannii TaxID=1890302 RepID=UPI003D246CB7
MITNKVRNIISNLVGNQEEWLLTEDGLYEVLMQSRKPIAKIFKKEVKRSNALKVY